MQTLKSFLDQTILIWKDSTAAGRFGIALLLILCVGSVIGVGIWSSQPNYIVLSSNLQPADAAKVIDALEAANVAYQVKGAGSIVLVDKRNWSRAKISVGKLGIDSAEANIEEISPWMDPLSQQDIFRRNLERQLENSIARYQIVKSAEVHLSIPEKQAFIRDSLSPSAAVVIEITPGTRFNESNAATISSLVANSVNGLRPDQVSISDTLGNEYTTDESLGRLTKQEEFRVLRDRELAQKAEMMLTRFLGLGNASVAVTTDFTFSTGTTTTQQFDPDGKVLVDETVRNSTTHNDDRIAAGVPGTVANSGENVTPPASSTRIGLVSKTEDLTNKYEVSSTSRTETMQTPIMNMMTVSVLVNKTSVQDEQQVVPAKVKESVEALVSQAVGFRKGKDQISVEYFEFVDTMPMEEMIAAPIPWDQINEILKNVSLGIAALVALFIGMKSLNKFRPETSTGASAAAPTSQISQLSEMVQQNPDVFSKIIESWSKQEGDGGGTTSEDLTVGVASGSAAGRKAA